ncbi:chymotrypsin inhibitor-like [Sitophilus oryzae]|uniref:Chymotrypsin inhibitor-like n=1 Tax=Sitophilus oryzae TaxID=7048 RepID=A0A6J2X4W6_SITOR|nr:chymotrypsin inhibitor-like [Sitophilus oryzae]
MRVVLIIAITIVVLLHNTDADEKECGTNEVFSTCASACPETCGKKAEFCILSCQQECVCKEGYLRHASTGKCVKPDEC